MHTFSHVECNSSRPLCPRVNVYSYVLRPINEPTYGLEGSTQTNSYPYRRSRNKLMRAASVRIDLAVAFKVLSKILPRFFNA
jgi:hypothetical protein